MPMTKEEKAQYDRVRHANISEEEKQRIRVKKKEYNNTENGKKCNRICTWKRLGVICEDWDALYDKYINTWNCENCDVELIEGKYGNNARHLDHDHETGLFRAVLCKHCNSDIFRKK